MGYYIRVLGIDNNAISHKTILKSNKKIENIIIEEGTPKNWTRLVVQNKDGDILTIEKSVVKKDSLGKDELEEFSEEIKDCFPKSAVNWLNEYFKKVEIIYAIRILNAAYKNENWSVVISIQEVIWQHVGGILQSDGEGFSNEDGYHILWQFENNVEGMWNMAILNKKNEWETFEMDLGNNEHRKNFKGGKSIIN